MISARIYSDVIVIEGNTIFDTPLDEILDTHRLASGSITALLKEFDMNKGGKGAKIADVATDDIFGISSWTSEQMRLGIEERKYQFNRIVFKTTEMDSKYAMGKTCLK